MTFQCRRRRAALRCSSIRALARRVKMPSRIVSAEARHVGSVSVAAIAVLTRLLHVRAQKSKESAATSSNYGTALLAHVLVARATVPVLETASRVLVVRQAILSAWAVPCICPTRSNDRLVQRRNSIHRLSAKPSSTVIA